MSGQLAPYNDSMRIGSGFNSYTQQLRINDAVVKENKTSATDDDLRPKLTRGDEGTVSQQVTFTSKFVDHASEITEALNISGALEIKWNGLNVQGSASYLDSSKVKESDLNYFVQVKVVNQQLIADNTTKFNAIPNVPVTDTKRFTDIYGDSYVSGFLEGGEFNALLSVKADGKESARQIKGALSLSLEKAGFGVSGSASGEYTHDELIKNSETSITVSWSGGGDIRDEESKAKGWTIDSMAKAAFSFPDRVRRTPQRTYAILTKYQALRSYQLLSNKGSPLDYENAGAYTNSLLESYMDYKDIWKQIGKMSAEYGQQKSMLKITSAATDTSNEIKTMKEEFKELLPKQKDGSKQEMTHIPEKPYDGTLVGLEKARRDCRSQMIRIVKEVDAVADDPKVAVDFNRVGQYLSPLLFRQLLPGTEPRPTEKEIKEERENHDRIVQRMAELEKTVESIRKKRAEAAGKPEPEINDRVWHRIRLLNDDDPNRSLDWVDFMSWTLKMGYDKTKGRWQIAPAPENPGYQIIDFNRKRIAAFENPEEGVRHYHMENITTYKYSLISWRFIQAPSDRNIYTIRSVAHPDFVLGFKQGQDKLSLVRNGDVKWVIEKI
ncbi:hypothetical protein SI65_09168 [Aspergillus cristatus]|uniref:MACPF domain-containing protein n=1 Tax=Aspergillus cristatus TaxID=573508 RepID=A0A1E3B3M3_ASPCR|nr:hypothetical protein SI65_09168 [Aspergillus cristatus]